MTKGGGQANIEFFGCPLECGYCAYSKAEKRDYELMEVLEFLADPSVDRVFLGGAEPGLQREELMELLRRINRMPHKKVLLKTTGFYPDLLKETIGMVDEYTLEIKCPLDDLRCNTDLSGMEEKDARRYASNLRDSLDALKGQRILVWIRVIPGYLNQEEMARIGEQVERVATSALLTQFLSNPESENPFMGIEVPGPSESEMVELGRVLIKYVPEVIIRGNGFSSEFRAA